MCVVLCLVYIRKLAANIPCYMDGNQYRCYCRKTEQSSKVPVTVADIRNISHSEAQLLVMIADFNVL